MKYRCSETNQSVGSFNDRERETDRQIERGREREKKKERDRKRERERKRKRCKKEIMYQRSRYKRQK